MAFTPYGYPGYGFNPGNTYMPQQTQQIPQMTQPMQSGVVCRPVSSIEEAKNMQVQFDGSLYAFINIGAGEIYTKQFNFNTGNTDFEVYTKAPKMAPPSYATVEQLEELRRELATIRSVGQEGISHDE